MKEFLKMFKTPSEADGYLIKDIPWIGAIESTGQIIECNTRNKVLKKYENYEEVYIESVSFLCSAVIGGERVDFYKKLNEDWHEVLDYLIDGGSEEEAEEGGEENTSSMSITELIIGSGITELSGYNRVYDFNTLQTIVIPNSILYLAPGAIESCSALTSIAIPDSVIAIDRRAFYDCYNLESITIGCGLKMVSAEAFYDLQSLTEINFDGTYSNAYDNGLYNCKFQNRVTIHCSDGNMIIDAYTGGSGDDEEGGEEAEL